MTVSRRSAAAGVSRTDELTYAHFAHYFPHAPLALCIKECARLAALRQYEVDGPILDVGCGDGLFAKIAFQGTEVWGIDIDGSEGRWAQASRVYQQIVLADITKAQLPRGFFKACVANCSLEHVPDIDAALRNIESSLVPGGLAYMFVPNKEWASKFMTVRAAASTMGPAVGHVFQEFIDEFFKHEHLYDEAGWKEVVERSPLELMEINPVLSTSTTVAFEAFLLPSILGWMNKRMTTRWTNFPGLRRRAVPVAYAIAKLAYALIGDTEKTAEFLIIARRRPAP